jgi:dsDNA-specific endonuclease/ATPase MutS2
MSWILATLLFVATLVLLSRVGQRLLRDASKPQGRPDGAPDDVASLPAVEATGDTLDLHGAAPAEIPGLVDAFIESSRQHGHRRVRIIHGKGTGTQRRTVRARLARRADVIGFADAPPPSGWGATIVEIDPGAQDAP